MTPLFYEDIEPGQVFTSRSEVLTRDRIVQFATEFDPQPQHVDEAAAATSLFGELVASGWHTGAVTMRLQIEALFGRFPGGAMGARLDSLAWTQPVRPGDALSVQVEVLAKRPTRSRPDRGLLSLQTTTLNQHGEPVQVMIASVLVPRRPS